MSKLDECINALCKSLGKNYSVRTIDLEPVIYRDFGNGFNVEISGVYTSSLKKKATLYLWFGDKQFLSVIVKSVRDVPRNQIGDKVDELYQLSLELIKQGLTTSQQLYEYAEMQQREDFRNF